MKTENSINKQSLIFQQKMVEHMINGIDEVKATWEDSA